MLNFDELNRLWDAHADRLLLIMRSHGEAAEEAVQEAFLALATQRRLPAAPLPWLIRTARNFALQSHRSNARRQQHHLAIRQSAPAVSGDTTHTSLEAREALEQVHNLPNDLAEIVMLHICGECTFSEIAAIVDSSRSVVHRKYTKAIQLLREKFDCSEKETHVRTRP